MKILIVDDTFDITDMFSIFLKNKGHTCVLENDGKKSLERIKNETYDVILLDLAMPHFSGHDVISALEKEGKLKELNIIVCTASSINQEDFEEILSKEGVTEVIKKPVKLTTLLETIEKSKEK